MSVIEVKNLCKTFRVKKKEKGLKGSFKSLWQPNYKKVEAVQNISFEVEKGEFVAIVGTSGSGKSTLLHMIGGVDKPTSGTIEINGVNIYELDEAKQAEFRRREVALIYQFYNLIPILNVEENS